MKTKAKTEPGLNTLAPSNPEADSPEARPTPLPHPEQRRVPLGDLILGDGFNRSDLGLSFDEFRRDIEQRGVVVPLIARNNGSKLEIFAGARRFAAAQDLKLEDVPCSVYPHDTPTKSMLELRLIENLQREGLTALDEARQMQEALAGGDYGTGRDAVTALAERVGKSTSHVYGRLRLLKLPTPLRTAWEKGVVPQSIVELIAQLPDEKDQVEALKAVCNEGGQYRDAEGKWIRETMSVRNAKAYLAREFQADLSKALWALDDAALDPKAGPCTTCKFRGGHDAGVPGVSDPDVCTLRDCYQKKRQLTLQARLDQAESQGKEVLSLKESEEAFRYGDFNLAQYKTADDKPWQDKARRTYEKLVGRDEPKPVHCVNPKDGKLVKLYRNAALNDALVKAGHNWAKPASGSDRAKPLTKEAKAKLEEERAIRAAVQASVVEAVMNASENPKLSQRQHANLWAFALKMWIEDCGEPLPYYFERRNVAPSSMDYLNKLSAGSDLYLEKVRSSLLENALMRFDDVYDEAGVALLANILEVDAKAIEKKVRAGKELAAAKLKKPSPVITKKSASEKNGKPAKPTKAPKKPKATKPPKVKPPTKKSVRAPKSALRTPQSALV